MTKDDGSVIRLDGEDAEAVARLEDLCFSTAWSLERYRQLFAAARPLNAGFNNFSAFGLRDAGGRLAAFVSLVVGPEELEIYNIAVHPDLRQTGLGKKLLGRVLDAAQEHGVTRAILEVRVSNVAALGLYRTLGFVECGRRKAYYADTGEDALVLCRDASAEHGERP